MSRSTSLLQQMTIFVTVVTGGGCAMMYYLMQKNFAKSEHYRLALEQLNRNSSAMASLGAPPLKIHNIHLSDRHNRIDHSSAQVSITNKHSSMYMRNTGFTTAEDPGYRVKDWRLSLHNFHQRRNHEQMAPPASVPEAEGRRDHRDFQRDRI
uniref:Cytochrome c oxidase assembly factor 1 n=1 Tax=Cyprinus carpio carpio TaxID=630221 RepID=A0A9J7YLH7_CYPCA